ncbi:MAG: hypothetical protein DME88_06515 [Verrucomicrobia bacterium]|nr:MAG: hypothetical protein DME88_06515 [Verrucomicrobiota bacterium]
MLPDCVDLVFLDPPFNISKPYDSSEFDDRYDPEFYKGLFRTWVLECIRVLRPGGARCLFTTVADTFFIFCHIRSRVRS